MNIYQTKACTVLNQSMTQFHKEGLEKDFQEKGCLHSCVVGVGADDVVGVHLVGVLDHAKEAIGLALAINGPRRIENMVPAVLGVDLGKHEKLDIILHHDVLVTGMWG